MRNDLARYHDTITLLDRRVGKLLDRLKGDGLADETIVFFVSDHGRGLPRGKRALQDEGMNVPLIVSAPEKYQSLMTRRPGGITDRLVSFIDFAPTVLSLAGIEPPDAMHGAAFLGNHIDQPRRYVYGSRDRVQEVVEVSRSVRGERYLYIRHYLPDRPAMQFSHGSLPTPTRRQLHRFAEQGEKLRADDPVVRYWAAVAARVQGGQAAPVTDQLLNMLDDPAPAIRAAAAEAVARLGHAEKGAETLGSLLRPDGKVITPGSAGYADLAVARDGTICCLYGAHTFEKNRSTMHLARFDHSWFQG